MRRFLALMLSVVMSIGAIAFTANAAKFTDVPASDETLTKAVELLSSVGITTGTTETTFGTKEKVTRQQMATFIFRLLKAGEERQGGVNSTSFTDLDDPFYYHTISWANVKGIIKGKSETIFDPKGSIILQDAYTMLVRALEHEKTGVLSYPIGYIEKAEEIGLDKGLSSKVDYTTALTRGDVAVLLYNAFFANMGTGNTAYENIYEEVNPDTLEAYLNLVEIRPYTVYDTIASKIYNMKKTVQRVVATPNYSLDNFKQTKEGDELVRLSVFDDEYAGDEDLFGEIDLESLKLPGTPDDLFLLDISIYYAEDDGDIEIYASNVIGEKKEAVAGGSGIFELSAGTAKKDYMFIDAYGNKIKKFTGKVTVGNLNGYLFNAPWSFIRPSEISYEAQNADNASFIYLDATQRDPKSEEFVQDYNFKSHRDALGRGYEYWSQTGLVGVDYDSNGMAGREVILKDEYHDERGGGLYSPWGLYKGMMFNLTSTSTKTYELDVWDSDGDGRIEYIWYKPYTAGVAETDDVQTFNEAHNVEFDRITGQEPNGRALFNYGPVYEAKEVPTIYTYGATNAGIDFLDGQIIKGYVNGPANYMKVTATQELTYQTLKFDKYDLANDGSISSRYFNGKAYSYSSGQYTYIGLPVNTGRPSTLSAARYYSMANVLYVNSAYTDMYYTKDDLEKEYLFAAVDNIVLHVKPADTLLPEKYAIIFPNDDTGEYCLSVPVGKVENGVLMKTADYVPALIDGVRVDVPAKVDSTTPESEDYPGRYDFSNYLGKLLSYTKNSKDEYIFKVAPADAHSDPEKLKTADEDVFYVYQDNTGIDTPALIKRTNGYYQFVGVNGSQYNNAAVSPFRYLDILDTTVIVIETVDEHGEKVFKTYTKDTMPEWGPTNTLTNVKYIVKNNPGSSLIENLVYMYAQMDSEEEGYVRNIYDYRIIKSVKTAKVDDEYIKYYDVYNPFTGTIEEEYEATNDLPDGFENAIYPLTTKGYISESNKMGSVEVLGKVATDEITKDEQGLGLRRIEFFDGDMGLLSVYDEEKLFKVDSKTIVTYLDLEAETIEKKSASFLSSTAKTYRCGENKDLPLVAFIASSEIKNDDDFEHAELVVVVRYDALESTLENLN